MRKIQILLSSLVIISGLGLFVSAPATVEAQTQAAKKAACEGAGGNWTGGQCKKGKQSAGMRIQTVIQRVIDVVTVLVGIVAVVMIIYGGFRYVTSGGDSQRVNEAKNTVLYAIIGLIIVALAQVIVRFVIDLSA